MKFKVGDIVKGNYPSASVTYEVMGLGLNGTEMTIKAKSGHIFYYENPALYKLAEEKRKSHALTSIFK